jgi:hypothetical protein
MSKQSKRNRNATKKQKPLGGYDNSFTFRPPIIPTSGFIPYRVIGAIHQIDKEQEEREQQPVKSNISRLKNFPPQLSASLKQAAAAHNKKQRKLELEQKRHETIIGRVMAATVSDDRLEAQVVLRQGLATHEAMQRNELQVSGLLPSPPQGLLTPLDSQMELMGLRMSPLQFLIDDAPSTSIPSPSISPSVNDGWEVVGGIGTPSVTMRTETVYSRPEITKEQIAFLESDEGKAAAKRLRTTLINGLFEISVGGKLPPIPPAVIKNEGHRIWGKSIKGGVNRLPFPLPPGLSHEELQSRFPLAHDFLFPKSPQINRVWVQMMIAGGESEADIEIADLEIRNWRSGNYAVERQRLSADE